VKKSIWLVFICVLLLGCFSAVAAAFSGGSEPIMPDVAHETDSSDVQSQPSKLDGVDTLIAAWEANGVEVLEAYAEGDDLSSMVVKVPGRTLAGSAGVTTSYQLHRQPAVLRKSGINVHLLTIYEVSDNGEETLYAIANIDDLVTENALASESLVPEDEAKASVEALVADVASRKGIASPTVTWGDGSDGLSVTVELVAPSSADGELGGFIDELNAKMTSLDQEDMGVCYMIMRVLDEGGNQVALELQDFDLAFGWRTLWTSPELRDAGDLPDFASGRH